MKSDSRKGVYNAVLPLDVLILKILPKKGATIMEVYPDGASIKDIRKQIGDGTLSINLLSTRLRVLHLHELVTSVTIPRAHTSGWQVTRKGEQYAADNSPKETDDGS